MAEKEYIEREKILQHLSDKIEAFGNLEGDFPVSYGGLLSMKYAHSVVRTAPKADVVEVVHAEWIPHEHVSRSPYARNYDCSACGNSPIETGDFCNKCGAKMDGERKKQE